jgi:tripartite-type tricarboxylate transporter receptor subunit TctC
VKISRTLLVAAITWVATFSVVSGQRAESQSYPKQNVRVVVPFSAGSVTDNLARLLADHLTKIWQRPVIVENRPGIAGTASVAKSEPDGHTLMLTSNGHTILAAVNENMTFDPVRDFSAVTQVASIPQVLIVPPGLGVTSVKEFVALARAKPGALSYASPGIGSATYIGAEVFKSTAKIDIVHVPYKGSPEAVTSVIRGDTQLYLLSINLATELAQSGKVRAIAISTPQRNPAMPDLPTVAESGLPSFEFDAWFGIMAPANTPAPLLRKISEDIAQVLQSPDIKGRLSKQGVEVRTSSPEVFSTVIKDDTVRNSDIVRKARAK